MKTVRILKILVAVDNTAIDRLRHVRFLFEAAIDLLSSNLRHALLHVDNCVSAVDRLRCPKSLLAHGRSPVDLPGLAVDSHLLLLTDWVCAYLCTFLIAKSSEDMRHPKYQHEDPLGFAFLIPIIITTTSSSLLSGSSPLRSSLKIHLEGGE